MGATGVSAAGHEERRVCADPEIAARAREIAERAVDSELRALVDISSPSGDVDGAEAAIEVCVSLLPEGAVVSRPECSTSGCAPDLVARLEGTGAGRLVLLGHVDTVFAHGEHAPLRDAGERLYGSGTIDMKGGDILALGVARALAADPSRFAELAVVMVCDEEWRIDPFRRAEEFAGFDACLCFEGGYLTPEGEEGVVVRRKAAATMLIDGLGRAAHSGSAPDQGRNALLAVARVAERVAAFHDPDGPEQLSVVPTVMRSGEAFNVVPAHAELICDMRARRLEAFDPVFAGVPDVVDEVEITSRMGRAWPGMDAERATAGLLRAAAQRIGRPVVGVPRGGASDASHFAQAIPMTVDGLGPRGGGAHTPDEYVLRDALRSRAEVALALAGEALAAVG
ncbi:MAG TPA: M20/M25/M40 family metallo-hydrolase [Solirubrobacteraceae bacterium]|nr:M20/M25/M40 family metallo-hydrolase [Solirubrobacteraceae bacterium]